ncbi:glycosyltransferase [Liquorilactobacillus sucicola DSM 21376 = JCM 15457]|uniref:Glycosyltransferase n=2 Tax=Liquorilactobacillus sucicola TaxID=519050 RepID=A0A0R2DTP9_9LACO|nr:glycosyltransferase [Liquorilactobacillus sucicola DSM 21376 = JCM 15457]
MGFWITWALIPVVVEIVPAFFSSIWLIARNWHTSVLDIPAKLPVISLIIPVYNSETTLFECIQSVNDSTYPAELVQIILADNQSTDNSFAAYERAQNEFPNLNLRLIHTEQGKAKALNSAIYSSIGTYIINIDSDGVLEKNALMNMVLRFENDSELSALTGTILPQKQLIKASKKRILKLLQRNEYFEYAQAFLSGRVIEARNNQLFTMSGAFSAFRKNDLLQTFLYNTGTIGEDTDMTFQIRDRLKNKVAICSDAIFYIEPIDSLNDLYIQRQRWQTGELEVVNQNNSDLKLKSFFKNFLVRRMMLDHTFLFPKLIWLAASIVLLFLGYSWIVLLLSYVLIYFLYLIVSLLNYLCVLLLLRGFTEEKAFFRASWWVVFTLPIYNFICSWFRLIGTLNSMTKKSSWNAINFSQEIQKIWLLVWKDIKLIKSKWR